MKNILFNKSYINGNETVYVNEVINGLSLSGNGVFTKKCHNFFQNEHQFGKCLLTTSCSSALEMAALLLDIKPGDEVIIPSYTFTSTANAFLIFGAKIVFADSEKDNPNIDYLSIESLINSRTKVIVVVHYAGVSCEMDEIMKIALKHKLYVVEDAAQAIDSYYLSNDGSKKRLGSIGHLAAISFHETKNITCGEGGMLIVNEKSFHHRAEVIWEKGTNRCSFYRGEIKKYEWVDIGSSYLPSEMNAAFLFAQLENLSKIQNKRKFIWQTYNNLLSNIETDLFTIQKIPAYAEPNAHIFYICTKDLVTRDMLSSFLQKEGIISLFHYQCLHKSPFFELNNAKNNLPQAEKFSNCLLRLPIHANMSFKDVDYIITCFKKYLNQNY